jgi:predicted transposase/invertase (TIGR01784 family)
MSIFKSQQDIVSLKADVRIAEQKGLEQGEQNKQREIAQAMLKSGYNRSEVARLTGLTPDQLT